MKYICCRCDLRAESSVGHHVCVAPADVDLLESLHAQRMPGQCVASLSDAAFFLGRNSTARGYRFTLTHLGADEYRVSFFCNVDTLAATALDTTPARAFARAFLRLPIESEGVA